MPLEAVVDALVTEVDALLAAAKRSGA
jgi:hypothetical protein